MTALAISQQCRELGVPRVAAWGRVVVWLLLLLAVAVVLAAVA